MRKPEAAGSQSPQEHHLPHGVAPDVLPEPEQNHPLHDKGGIVQHHKEYIRQKRDLVEHLPHNIVFHREDAHPHLIFNRR